MSTENDLLLSIDVGTQSIRAIIFNLKGEIVKSKRVEIIPYVSENPGWAEHEPEYYWKKLCETTRALLHWNAPLAKKLCGMSLTTQRATLINLDKNYKPLRPAMVWPDQRRTKKYRKIKGIMGLVLKLIGMHETVCFAQGESEINWLEHYQPEIMKKTYKFVFLSGYLIYKLTGHLVDSYASQVGYVPFDYKRFDWCRKGDWHWDAFPIGREKLPELVAPASLFGTVSHSAHRESSIPYKLPFIASGSDKTCEFLGAGCLTPESAGISYGTTATIGIYTRKYVEAIPFIPAYPSAIPGIYNPEFQIYRGFWLVSWFKKEFGTAEIQKALKQGVEPEELLDTLLDESPPGALGLMLQPTWSPGVKIPGPEAKGSVIGFGDAHTRSHLYRAIIEGLCYGLRSGGERIQKRSRTKFREIRVSGGGSQSLRTLQITADIFNLPVLKPHVHDTSCLGAAIDTAVGLHYFDNFHGAIDAMTRVERIFEPDPQNTALYDELYTQVYKHIYEKLKPYYHKIRDITGYPD